MCHVTGCGSKKRARTEGGSGSHSPKGKQPMLRKPSSSRQRQEDEEQDDEPLA